MRTEYQPPADVLAQIHAFLEANPDFFGKEKRRAPGPLEYAKGRSAGPLATGSGKPGGIALQEGDVKRTPLPTPGTTIKAERLMPGAEWMARIAMYAGEAEWLQHMDIDRKLGLVMEAFNMILILSGGNDELLSRIMGNKDAMLSALRLAYEIDRATRKDAPPA